MMTFEYGTYGYIAMKDLRAAKMNLEMCPHISAQCSHAAVEKMLKHLIVTYKPDSVERREMLKKHKLKVLSRYLKIAALSKYISRLSEFDSFYYDTRYPGEDYYDVTEEQAKEMLDVAVSLCSTAMNVLEQPNCSLNTEKSGHAQTVKQMKLEDLTK